MVTLRRILASVMMYRIAIVSLSVATLSTGLMLVFDDGGSDAAELFRFPLQLNLYASIGVLVCTAFAFPLAWVLRGFGWQSQLSTRWVWVLVVVFPLILGSASLVFATFDLLDEKSGPPAGSSSGFAREVLEKTGVDGLPPLLGPDAFWLAALGTGWFAWFVHSLLRWCVRHRAAHLHVAALSQSDDVQVVFAGDRTRAAREHTAAFRFRIRSSCDVEDVQYQMQFRRLQEIYLSCAKSLGLTKTELPTLLIATNQRTRLNGPFYFQESKSNSFIVLPNDLNMYVQQAIQSVEKELGLRSEKSDPQAFDPRE